VLSKVDRGPTPTRALCDGAFEALRELHAAGFAHGDARLPNLMRRAGERGADGGVSAGRASSLVWVDMRLASAGDALERPSAVQRADARTLAASLLGHAGTGADAALPRDVEAAVSRVAAGPAASDTEDGDRDLSYRELSRAVWGELVELRGGRE
jgi:hypothetical protein